MGKVVWGIDISRTSVKATKLSLNRSVPTIMDIAVLPYRFGKKKISESEQNELYVQTLDTLKKTAKISRLPVYISLPTHAIFNRIIKVTMNFDDPKFEQTIAFETASQIPFPIDQVVWKYMKVEREYSPDEEKEAVILAVKKDIIDNFLEIIKPVGLNIRGVQIAPVALYNFLRFDQDMSNPTLVLDIGADNTSLIISENEKLWIRNLPITGNDITIAIQEKLNVPFEHAEKLKVRCSAKPDRNIYEIMQDVYKNLVAEIHRSLGFYKTFSRDASFKHLILLGQASRSYRLKEYLSQSLQLNVVRLQSIHNMEVSNILAHDLLGENITSIGVSLGLGLEGLGMTSQDVNLLPREIAESIALSRKKPWFIVAGAMFTLLMLFSYMSLSAKEKQLAAECAKIDDQIEQLQDNRKKLKKALEGMVPDKAKKETLPDFAESLYQFSKAHNAAPKQLVSILETISKTLEHNSFDKRVWLLSSFCFSRFKPANPGSGRDGQQKFSHTKELILELDVAMSKYAGKELTDIIDFETLQIKAAAQSQTLAREYIEKLFPKEIKPSVRPQDEIVLPRANLKESAASDLPKMFYSFKVEIRIDL